MPSDLRTSPKRGKRKGGPKVLSAAWVTEAFKAFGRHCARNQIRVLLIDSFVMTTLFYPALALHLQRRFPPVPHPLASTSALHSRINAKQHPLSLLSTPILDSVFPEPEPILPYPASTVFWDLERDEWDARLTKSRGKGHRGAGAQVDITAVSVAWTSVRRGLSVPAFGLLRLPGRSAQEDNVRISNFGTELDSLALQLGGGGEYDGRALTCVRDSSVPSTCFTSVGAGDSDIRRAGLRQAVDPQESEESLWQSKTFYFARKNHTGVATPADHTVRDDWMRGMENISIRWKAELQTLGLSKSAQGEEWLVFPVVNGSSPQASLDATTDTSDSRSLHIPLPILILYACVLGYLMFCLTEAHQAHSRFGLAFTGVVQLACSTIMSFSVMILLGWGGQSRTSAAIGQGLGAATQDGVPWYLLPFVVVIVGVENMSAITKAVYAIPVTYSVPDRLGEALGKVGETLFVTSAVDIAVLLVIRFTVSLRPVQDLCTFAAVLIFVDWWMLHTFYLTVLSIDCQRLGLSDLIKQGKPAPEINGIEIGSKERKHLSPVAGRRKWLSIIMTGRRVLRARSARGFSSLVLLALLTILYYVNESHQARALRMLPGVWLSESFALPDVELDALSSGAAQIWSSLSRYGHSRAASRNLVVTSLPPLMVVLPSPSIPMTPRQLLTFVPPLQNRLAHRLKPLFYLFKVVLLPQGVTAFSLYLILLFLLKDAGDLQPDRTGRAADEIIARGGQSEDVEPLAWSPMQLAAALRVTFRRTIGRPDITSHLVSVTGEIAITKGVDGLFYLTTAAGTFVIRAMTSPWIGADVTKDGKHFVIASRAEVLLYQVDDLGFPRVIARSRVEGTAPPIIAVAVTTGPEAMPHTTAVERTFAIAVSDKDAAVHTFNLVQGLADNHPLTSESAELGFHFARLKGSRNAQGFYAMTISRDGAAQIRYTGDSGWTRTLRRSPSDAARITAIDVEGDGGRTIIAIGTASGVIELWDATTGSLWLEASVGTATPVTAENKIRRIQLVRRSECRCPSCGMSEETERSIIWSISDITGIITVSTAALGEGCVCAAHPLRPSPSSINGNAFLTPVRAVGRKTSGRRRSSATPSTPSPRGRLANGHAEAAVEGDHDGDESPVQVTAWREWRMRHGAWALLSGEHTLLIIRRAEHGGTRWEAVFVSLEDRNDGHAEDGIAPVLLEPPSEVPMGGNDTPVMLLSERRERSARAWSTRPKVGEPFLTRVDAPYPPLGFSHITRIVAAYEKRVDVVAGNMVIGLQLPGSMNNGKND